MNAKTTTSKAATLAMLLLTAAAGCNADPLPLPAPAGDAARASLPDRGEAASDADARQVVDATARQVVDATALVFCCQCPVEALRCHNVTREDCAREGMVPASDCHPDMASPSDDGACGARGAPCCGGAACGGYFNAICSSAGICT